MKRSVEEVVVEVAMEMSVEEVVAEVAMKMSVERGAYPYQAYPYPH
jgi:hypothetical protein